MTFRDVIGVIMVAKYGHKIGGEGMTVEIDKSMFRKVSHIFHHFFIFWGVLNS